MLQSTAAHMASYEAGRRVLPEHPVVVPRDQGRTDTGLRHAIITIISRDLREAITIREMARQTVVTVPHWFDSHGFRMASTWWIQPRGETERRHAWRPQPQA